MTSYRIALISSSFRPYAGGVEEHTLNVARQLRERGHSVVVWTVDRGEELGTQKVDGIEVRYLPCPLPARVPRAIMRFLLELPSAFAHWRSAYRQARPQVLHVQCFGPNGLYALALHYSTRTPLIVSSHGETFADDHDVFATSRFLRGGLVRALRDADEVTGCSQVVLEDLAERFGSTRGSVVPNGVDLDEAKSRADLTFVAGSGQAKVGPTVLALGRVERVKGFDLLIKAFARADLPIDTRLVIGGDGRDLDRLRHLAKQQMVGERVEFPGRLSRDEVVSAMAGASVLVVPSRLEAFGIVILEAWRAGVPVIATSLGGPRDVITDGVDGLLVDPEDLDALAGQLSRVISDPGLAKRLGEAGALRVRDYTWAHTAQMYERVYEGVLQER